MFITSLAGLIAPVIFLSHFVNSYRSTGAFFTIFLGGVLSATQIAVLTNYHEMPELVFANYSLYFIAGCLLALVILSISLRLRSELSKHKPHFNFLGPKVPLDGRVSIIFLVWLIIIMMTQLFGFFEAINRPIVSESFYASWCQDVLFFTIMGFAVLMVTLRVPHDEDFTIRLGILFPMLSGSALESVSENVKPFGYVNKKLSRKIIVKEYSERHQAYLVEFEITNELENVFGDTVVEDTTNAAFTPDDFSDLSDDAPFPVGEFHSIKIGNERMGFTEKIVAPLQIKPSIGYRSSFPLSVPSEGLHVAIRYWAWIRVGVEQTFETKRFLRKHECTMVNRMRCGSDIYFELLGQSGPDHLKYNSEIAVGSHIDLSPNQKRDLIRFNPPPQDPPPVENEASSLEV